MSRRSIILLITCAALALLSVLWLTRDVSAPQTRAQVPAQSEATPSPSPSPTPEVANADHRTARESIGAPATPSPVTAPATTDATPTLIVHVVAKETGKPFRAARVSMWPKAVERGFSIKNVDRSSGSVREGLRPGDDGTVEFTDVPAGAEFHLSVFGDRNVAGTADRDLSPLAASERRELRIELATENDLTLFGRVVARSDNAPVVHAHVRAGTAEKSTMSVRGKNGA